MNPRVIKWKRQNRSNGTTYITADFGSNDAADYQEVFDLIELMYPGSWITSAFCGKITAAIKTDVLNSLE